jgi:hypothetical protein
VDVESVSDELYALPLDQFTSSRTDREKQAKSDGDKDLAAQIHRMAKPNLVAWLANQLAREHAQEIRFLLQLGPALREATATGAGQQLRELSRQQSQVVYAVVQQARKLASAAGHKVSQDTARGLEDTLRAALADPDAADALAAGRLTDGMQNSGFGSPTSGFGSPGRNERSAGSGSATGATATPPKGKRKSPGRAEQKAGQATTDLEQAKSEAEHAKREAEHAKRDVEQARRDVEQASSTAETLITSREKAVTQLEAAARTVVDTDSKVKRLRRELDEALASQSRAHEDHQRAQAALGRVDRDAQEAQEQLANVTQRLADAVKRLDAPPQ